MPSAAANASLSVFLQHQSFPLIIISLYCYHHAMAFSNLLVVSLSSPLSSFPSLFVDAVVVRFAPANASLSVHIQHQSFPFIITFLHCHYHTTPSSNMLTSSSRQFFRASVTGEGAFRPASYREPTCESDTSSPVAANRKPRLPTGGSPVIIGKATPVQDLAARLQARRRSQEQRLADMEARLRQSGTVNTAAPSMAPTPQVRSQAFSSRLVGVEPAVSRARSQAFPSRTGNRPAGIQVGFPPASGNQAAPTKAPISRARSNAFFARIGVTPPPEPQVRTEPTVAEVLLRSTSDYLSSRSSTLPSGGSSSVRQHGVGVVATSSAVSQPKMESARTTHVEHASRPAGVSSRKRKDEPRRISSAPAATTDSSRYRVNSEARAAIRTRSYQLRAEHQEAREALQRTFQARREERLLSGSHRAAPSMPESPPTEPARWSRRSETRLGAGSVAARVASTPVPASMLRTHVPFDRQSSKTWVRREAVRQEAEKVKAEETRQRMAKVTAGLAKMSRVVRFDDNVQVQVIENCLEDRPEDDEEPDVWLQIAEECESGSRLDRQSSWTW